MDFIIRRGGRSDWPAISELHERARECEPHFVAGNAGARIASLEHVFQGELWVAEAEKTMIGFVASVANAIAWIYVEPAYFRQGIGRCMLRHALTGCGAVANCEALSDNHPCLALLRSEGFVEASDEFVQIDGYGAAASKRMRRVTLVPSLN